MTPTRRAVASGTSRTLPPLRRSRRHWNAAPEGGAEPVTTLSTARRAKTRAAASRVTWGMGPISRTIQPRPHARRPTNGSRRRSSHASGTERRRGKPLAMVVRVFAQGVDGKGVYIGTSRAPATRASRWPSSMIDARPMRNRALEWFQEQALSETICQRRWFPPNGRSLPPSCDAPRTKLQGRAPSDRSSRRSTTRALRPTYRLLRAHTT
jgi:hypothetical protein